MLPTTPNKNNIDWLMAFLACKKEDLPRGVWTEDIEKWTESEYTFEHCGLQCKVKRCPGWNWNGYVTVPPSHAWFNKTYDEIEDKVSVHGDLTFGPGNGTFGFDTSHMLSGDIVPGEEYYKQSNPALFPDFSSLLSVPGHRTQRQFWTFEQVKAETMRLAEQF